MAPTIAIGIIIVVAVAAFVVWRYTSVARGARARNEALLKRLDPIGERLAAATPVTADEVRALATSPELRPMLYEMLRHYDHLELFPTHYLSEQAQAESALAYWMLHPNELQAAPARLELEEVLHRDLLGRQGTFYVFRYTMPSGHWAGSQWLLGLAGPFFPSATPYQGPAAGFARAGDVVGTISPGALVDWNVAVLGKRGGARTAAGVAERDGGVTRRRAWAGLAALTLAGAGAWYFFLHAPGRDLRRVDDHAGVLPKDDIPRFEQYLSDLERESGIDVRFVFRADLAGESLERFAVRTARNLGIGRDLDRHGVLFVYDVLGQRLRVEVGPTLQGVFPDGFVGYLIRENAHSLFAAGDPSLGLRLTLFMLHARLRRAALGDEYDPRAVQFIEDRRRLATGGGASAPMAAAGAPALRNRPATEVERLRFVPQPTVAAAYERYLEWVQRGGAEVDVDLFTRASQEYLSRLPMPPAFADYVLFLEYGRTYEILERGDLAMLYFTDDPLVSPHFFRRTAAGWQVDLFGDVRHSHEYAGGAWTWSMVERDDDVTQTFRDRYIHVNSFIRIAGGDNRPIPIYSSEVGRQFTRPGAADIPGLERVTVAEVAARIVAARGRPVVVLFYSIGNKKTQRHFAALMALLRRCEARGAVVLAFSVDEPWFVPPSLPGYLREHDAPFAAIHVYEWLEGQFAGALAPLGIRVGSQWRPPLIALLDRDGRVLAQAQGIVSEGPDLAVGEIEAALADLGGGRVHP